MGEPSAGPHRHPGGFPLVGVVGAGQLARMMVPPAIALSIGLRVLSENEDDSAALVTAQAPLGTHTDLDALRELARDCDVVTFDHEHVPPEHLRALEDDGAVVRPSASALVHAQDKVVMRQRLSAMGVPCPRWAVVRRASDLQRFGAEVGWPVVLKTPRGGYDGKGVLVVNEMDDARDWLDRIAEQQNQDAGTGQAALLAEERVPFIRELAVLVARSPMGQAAAWPVVETVQTDGICTEVIAPAPDLDPTLAARATDAALHIAGELDVTGVMAVELFELPGHEFVVNELAMRPHNSGHWTIDGSVTSQFEQHLRAVLDLPLGDTRPRARWTVMANVLGGADDELYSTYLHLLARDPALKVHLYGKRVRPGRKIGHVTVCGDDLAELRERARHAAAFIQGVVRE